MPVIGAFEGTASEVALTPADLDQLIEDAGLDEDDATSNHAR